MTRPILLFPDPRLKKLCDPVGRITPEIEALADEMLATMYAAPGVGLAAPQVGVLSRLFVMDCTKDPEAPRAPLVANVTAAPVHDPDVIRKLLVEQVTGRVRWRESMTWLATQGGVTRFAEAGAGKVLSGMAKRIAPDAEATPLNTPADLEAFAASL